MFPSRTLMLLLSPVLSGQRPAVHAAARSHWAFEPPHRVEPSVSAKDPWVRGLIDRHVLARLRREGLAPSPQADRATLLRRLSLDLTGLPPSLAELDAFLADDSPDAWRRQVERLLDRPAYGEHQARFWLDLARYADTNGYEKDAARVMWKYRDWVIEAFNRDMPFDEFTIQQLAGDLLPDASTSQKVATGFHCNTMRNQEGGVDPEEYRIETVVDRANTTATVWLGLTLGCARCHDHKYDPITQEEYYRFFAFFNDTDDVRLELPSAAQTGERRRLEHENEVELQRRAPELERAFDRWCARMQPRRTAAPPEKPPEKPPAKMPADVRAILALDPAERSEKQSRRLLAHFRSITPWLADVRARRARLRKLASRVAKTTVLAVHRPGPRETHVLARGSFASPRQRVTPGVPAVLGALPPGVRHDRLALARWLVSKDNPLGARVLVNRIWSQVFGRGLVSSNGDFGVKGEAPTHPALLDALALEVHTRGWSIKQLYRLIVMSSTYRQSSKMTPLLRQRDPDNRWLARGARYRLDAETIRDVALAASGRLQRKLGGPSVFPPQPPGIWTMIYSRARWRTNKGADRYRRGLYTYWRRTAPYPAFAVFDAPSREISCVRRGRTDTPLQALATLNGPAFFELAKALGARMRREGADTEARLGRGFRLCTARRPLPRELVRLRRLLEATEKRYAADPRAARRLLGEGSAARAGDLAELAAYTIVANALLNLDETLSRG